MKYALLLLSLLVLPALSGQSPDPDAAPNYDNPPPNAKTLRKGNLIVRSKIVTGLSALPPLQGRSFLIRPADKKKASDKAFAAYAKLLSRVLAHRGMVPQTDPAKRPDLLILMGYALHEIDPDEAHPPIVGEGMRFAKAEARLYRHDLVLIVLDETGSGSSQARLAYKGSISSDGPSPVFRGVMPKMMILWGKSLPGKTGEKRLVEGPN